MHMQMAPARLGSVCVLLIFELDRYRNQTPVADATLGDDMPRKVAHVAHRALQYRHLQTTVVVLSLIHISEPTRPY